MRTRTSVPIGKFPGVTTGAPFKPSDLANEDQADSDQGPSFGNPGQRRGFLKSTLEMYLDYSLTIARMAESGSGFSGAFPIFVHGKRWSGLLLDRGTPI
jgi:hypothetical protein